MSRLLNGYSLSILTLLNYALNVKNAQTRTDVHCFFAGSLVAQNTSSSTGTDSLGTFARHEIIWSASPPSEILDILRSETAVVNGLLSTAVRVYSNNVTAVFECTVLADMPGTNITSIVDPVLVQESSASYEQVN